MWASRHGTRPAWTAWTADGERRTVLAVRAHLLWTADRVGGSRGWVPESDPGGLPRCVPELSRRPCSTKRKAMAQWSSGAYFPKYTWGAVEFYLRQPPGACRTTCLSLKFSLTSSIPAPKRILAIPETSRNKTNNTMYPNPGIDSKILSRIVRNSLVST